TKGDGTGMGLSICHRIISDHGGQVHVTSQPGRGTIFNIHLPIQQFPSYPLALFPVEGKDEGGSRAENAEPADRPLPSEAEKPGVEGETILALRPPSV